VQLWRFCHVTRSHFAVFHDKQCLLQTPREKIQRGEIWRTRGPGNGSAFSYLTMRKFPVHKGTNITWEVRWKTVLTGGMAQTSVLHHSQKSVTVIVGSSMKERISDFVHQSAPLIGFRWMKPMFSNIMRIFTSLYTTVASLDCSTRMKSFFIRKTQSVDLGLILFNAGKHF